MKKIFIAALVITMCCVMLVPVSASDFNGTELPYYDKELYPYICILEKTQYGSYTIYVSDQGFHVTYSESTGKYALYADGNFLRANYDSDGWVDFYASSVNNTVFTLENAVIESNYIVKDALGNKYSIDIPCDGSTCPATDVNTDNICDDCGMVFAVLRSYDAPDPYTAWTADRQANFPYVFIYKNEIDANVFIMASTRPYVQDGQIVIDTNSEHTSYLKYTQWGNDWRLVESYDDGTTITADTLVSSFNILDTDGNIVYNHDTDFFPVPLWVEMDNLTQGEMVNKFNPTLVGMILTLTVCGVGCLALLVVLKLFGKRSLTYLK